MLRCRDRTDACGPTGTLASLGQFQTRIKSDLMPGQATPTRSKSRLLSWEVPRLAVERMVGRWEDRKAEGMNLRRLRHLYRDERARTRQPSWQAQSPVANYRRLPDNYEQEHSEISTYRNDNYLELPSGRPSNWPGHSSVNSTAPVVESNLTKDHLVSK